MARFRLVSCVRIMAIWVIVSILLVIGLPAISAAAPSPGLDATGTGVVGQGSNTYTVNFGIFAAGILYDCGGPAATCQIWVARNNAPIASEVLFQGNLTGTNNGSAGLAANFIVDGCYNFRAYAGAAHATLLGQINVGHINACNFNGTGNATLGLNGSFANQAATVTGPQLPPSIQASMPTPMLTSGVCTNLGAAGTAGCGDPSTIAAVTIDWDSGYAGQLEDGEIWIQQATAANPALGTYPSPSEVLYSRYPSTETKNLAPTGGGPYALALYRGTGHGVVSVGPVIITTSVYEAFDPASGYLFYNTANSTQNGAVCVYKSGLAGNSSTLPAKTAAGLFTFNSFGFGNAAASFQVFSSNHNENVYDLFANVAGTGLGGAVTPGDCGSLEGGVPTGATGTLAASLKVRT